jgi:hypothetical protein
MKNILAFTIVVLVLNACMKSKTCTCKNSAGTVQSAVTKKTSSKSDLQKFEDDCKNAKIQETSNGVVTTSTPCELT